MKAPAPQERQIRGQRAQNNYPILPLRPSVTIVAFRKQVQNTRQGFFDLRLNASGVVIRDCVWSTSHGKTWTSMPARRDDQGRWRPVVVVEPDAKQDALQDAIRTAMAAYQSRGR